MKNDEPDKQVFKLKKNPKRKKNEKDSNSSKDSLELTIQSLQDNNKMPDKETGEGEKVKFFFNELPKNNANRFATTSNRKYQKLNINLQKEKEELDFREILLNYVNQTGRTNENKSIRKEERDSIIYTKPNGILTLNGDNETNKDEFSNQISESSSEYNNSKSLSESISDKKTEKMEELDKKSNKGKNKKNSPNHKKINNEQRKKGKINNNIIVNKNKGKKCNEKKSIKNNDKNSKKIKEDIIFSGKKGQILEMNNELIINSYHNKFTNSNKIKSLNTFTTGANTSNTQNTQNSSFKSLQLNIKKFNYEYLNLTDISLKKKLIIQSRINSGKKSRNQEGKDKIDKIAEINNGEEKLFEKIKNINISLDIEKSYSNYFKQIINLQNKKSTNEKLLIKNKNNSNKELKTTKNKQHYQSYFYYPDEYYIDKNNDLHSKSHVSKFFEKIKKNC